MWEKIWEFIVNSSKPIISTIIVILAVVLINIIFYVLIYINISLKMIMCQKNFLRFYSFFNHR